MDPDSTRLDTSERALLTVGIITPLREEGVADLDPAERGGAGGVAALDAVLDLGVGHGLVLAAPAGSVGCGLGATPDRLGGSGGSAAHQVHAAGASKLTPTAYKGVGSVDATYYVNRGVTTGQGTPAYVVGVMSVWRRRSRAYLSAHRFAVIAIFLFSRWRGRGPAYEVRT